jgi:hypothetical protein
VLRSRNRSFSLPGSPLPINRQLAAVLGAAALLLLSGALVVLASWDMPAPSKPFEKVIPDERFSR